MSRLKIYVISFVASTVTLFVIFTILLSTVNPKKLPKNPTTEKLEENILRSVSQKEVSDILDGATIKPQEYYFDRGTEAKPIRDFPRRNMFSNITQLLTTRSIPLLPGYLQMNYDRSSGMCNNHHDKDTVAIISLKHLANNPALISKGTEVCNKTKCIYRLVVSNDPPSNNKTKKNRRNVPDVPDNCFKKSNNDKKHIELDHNSVLLKFLGVDFDGTPIVDIQIGSNLLNTNFLSSDDASMSRWLPYNKESNESNVSYNNNYVDFKNVTHMQNDKIAILHKIIQVRNAGTTEDVNKNITGNNQESKMEPVKNHLIELKNQVELAKDFKMKLSDNTTVSTKNITDTDLDINIDNQPPMKVFSEYDSNFGGYSEDLVNASNLEMFFKQSHQLDTRNPLSIKKYNKLTENRLDTESPTSTEENTKYSERHRESQSNIELPTSTAKYIKHRENIIDIERPTSTEGKAKLKEKLIKIFSSKYFNTLTNNKYKEKHRENLLNATKEYTKLEKYRELDNGTIKTVNQSYANRRYFNGIENYIEPATIAFIEVKKPAQIQVENNINSIKSDIINVLEKEKNVNIRVETNTFLNGEGS